MLRTHTTIVGMVVCIILLSSPVVAEPMTRATAVQFLAGNGKSHSFEYGSSGLKIGDIGMLPQKGRYKIQGVNGPGSPEGFMISQEAVTISGSISNPKYNWRLKTHFAIEAPVAGKVSGAEFKPGLRLWEVVRSTKTTRGTFFVLRPFGEDKATKELVAAIKAKAAADAAVHAENAAAAAEAARWRTFTDASGKHKIVAEFKGFIAGKLKLIRKSDGKKLTLPLSALSNSDQEWIRNKLRSKQ